MMNFWFIFFEKITTFCLNNTPLRAFLKLYARRDFHRTGFRRENDDDDDDDGCVPHATSLEQKVSPPCYETCKREDTVDVTNGRNTFSAPRFVPPRFFWLPYSEHPSPASGPLR